MLRARLGLGAALLGFWILVAELGFTAYSFISIYRLIHNPFLFIVHIPAIALYLPGSILALGSLLGGVALGLGVRGHTHWSWYAATLTPIIALLAIYRPSLGASGFNTFQATVPWMAPLYWGREGNIAVSIGLQIALCVAPAAFALAAALALPRGRVRARDLSTVPVSALRENTE
jgi:hypothetical protein